MNAKVGGEFTVEGHTVVFKPARDLAFDTRYQVMIDAGVTSTAGGNGMVRELCMGVYHSAVTAYHCHESGGQRAERFAVYGFQHHFNAPIDPATVMPNIEMTPPISPTLVYTYYSSYNNTFSFSFGAEPSSEYKVTISAGIADPYGNTIPRGQVVQFRTAPLDPNYVCTFPDTVGTYDAGMPRADWWSVISISVA